MLTIAYEVYANGTMQAKAPIEGITVPTDASATTRGLRPGWYVATLGKGCLSLDCATFSYPMTRNQAMKAVGGAPYDE